MITSIDTDLGYLDVTGTGHQHLHGTLRTKVGFQHFLQTLKTE